MRYLAFLDYVCDDEGNTGNVVDHKACKSIGYSIGIKKGEQRNFH